LAFEKGVLAFQNGVLAFQNGVLALQNGRSGKGVLAFDFKLCYSISNYVI
jgi:hypothetical protein